MAQYSGYGTNDLKDASLFSQFGEAGAATVAEFGEDKAYEAVQGVLDAYNAELDTLLEEFTVKTDQYQMVYGGTPDFAMRRGNEYSNPDAIKMGAGLTVGLTLDKSEAAVQWTKRAFQQMSVAKLQLNIKGILSADNRDIRRSLMRAIFTPVTDLAYVDNLHEQRQYAVYPFLNADGRPVPAAADGSAFNPNTHSHYTAATVLNEDVVRATLQNVTEHGEEGEVVIFISKGFETAFFGMSASGAFHPRLQANIIPVMPAGTSMGAGYSAGGTLDRDRNNRTIGTFDGYEVRVRSWVPNQYLLVMDLGSDTVKPLAYRTLPDGLYSELGLRFEDETYPLRAQMIDRYYGITPWGRHMAAMTYISTAISNTSPFSGVYVAPNV